MPHDDTSREPMTESAAPAPNPDTAPSRDGGPAAGSADAAPEHDSGFSARVTEAKPDEAASEAALSGSGASSISVPAQAAPTAGDGPIVIPPSPQRRGRKWARRVEDLPRSERWKRRLPEVCR